MTLRRHPHTATSFVMPDKEAHRRDSRRWWFPFGTSSFAVARAARAALSQKRSSRRRGRWLTLTPRRLLYQPGRPAEQQGRYTRARVRVSPGLLSS